MKEGLLSTLTKMNMKWTNDGTKCIITAMMVISLFELVGCATPQPIRVYAGPELSASQVVKISPAPIREDFGKIRVLALDGKEIQYSGGILSPDSGEILIPPGQHDIRAGIRAPGQAGLLVTGIANSMSKKWDSTLHFNAETGKSYTLFGELIKDPEGEQIGWLGRGRWVYWMEESQSGTVVCGRHPAESDTFVNERRSLMQHDYSKKH